MTNQELAKAINHRLFADCGTDLDAAIKEAYRYINAIPQAHRIGASVGMHIVLNTIANIIKENEQ